MLTEGKRNSIRLSGGDGGPHVVHERAGHAPVFARPGEPEPNVISGERLRPAEARPRREASRTLAEAREHGLSMPEALGAVGDGTVDSEG